MQKESRHFSGIPPVKTDLSPKQEKQFRGPAPQPRKLLDHIRDVLRVNHYSVRTEEAYVGWIRRYILYHNKKHPRERAALEVELYLTHLAVGEKVSTNTQKQALNALVFLYHRVLQKPLGQFRDISRPKKPQRRPLVLSKNEVERILRVMGGTHQLIATLLFRHRNAAAGMLAPAGKGCRSCAQSNRRSGRQRLEESSDNIAAKDQA